MEYVKISDITKSVCTGLNPRKNFTLNTKDANNYYVTVKEITSNKVVFSESTDKVNDDGLKIIQNRSHLEKGDVLFSGIGTIGKVAYIDFDTNNWNCSESVFILKPNDRILGSFLFYVLQSQDVVRQYEANSAGSIMKGVRKSTLVNIKLPLPPLAVQKEIVGILDTFTRMIDNLQKELEQRQKQFEYYRSKFFAYNEDECDWFSLPMISENCDRKRKPIKGSKREKGIYPYYGASGIVDYVKDYILDGEYLLISEDGANLVARNTPIAFSIEGKNWVNNHAHVVKFNSLNDQRFVEYYFNSIDLTPWISGGAQPKLNQENLNKILIPYPSVERRNIIVDTLKSFEALISNIKQEIELRQKQYEYYREKLLTFE